MPDKKLTQLPGLPAIPGDTAKLLFYVVDTATFANPINQSRQMGLSMLDAHFAPATAKYIIQTANAALASAQVLSTMATGLVKNTTGTGVLSIADTADIQALMPIVDDTPLVFKTGSPAITATIDANALSAARVFALPDAATTLAGLSVAQTFTAQQIIAAQIGLPNLILGNIAPIGNNNADGLIRIYGEQGGATAYLDIYHSGINAYLDANSSNWNFKIDAGKIFDIREGTTLILRTRGYKVGIGTALSPATKLYILDDTAINNSVLDVLTLGVNATGAIIGATGFGPGVLFIAETSTTDGQDMARIASAWNDGTHATRSADIVFSTVHSAAALAEKLRLTSAGILKFSGTMGNSSKDPTVDAPADWVEIQIGANTYYLPAYAA